MTAAPTPTAREIDLAVGIAARFFRVEANAADLANAIARALAAERHCWAEALAGVEVTGENVHYQPPPWVDPATAADMAAQVGGGIARIFADVLRAGGVAEPEDAPPS